jgi:hypothetical protein
MVDGGNVLNYLRIMIHFSSIPIYKLMYMNKFIFKLVLVVSQAIYLGNVLFPGPSSATVNRNMGITFNPIWPIHSSLRAEQPDRRLNFLQAAPYRVPGSHFTYSHLSVIVIMLYSPNTTNPNHPV